MTNFLPRLHVHHPTHPPHSSAHQHANLTYKNMSVCPRLVVILDVPGIKARRESLQSHSSHSSWLSDSSCSSGCTSGIFSSGGGDADMGRRQ